MTPVKNPPEALPVRIGHGFDLHRLESLPPDGEGKPFILAGVTFEHPVGPVGHSDGDAVFHAVTDALLGAIGEPDIGQLFPDTDPVNEGRDSSDFLREASRRIREAGFAIGNLDVTVVCERPKLNPMKSTMIENLARVLDCDTRQVNIKGKTHEQVDAIGEGRAVAVHVVVLLTSCKNSGPEMK
ncbi:MAG: 2-C-methyl-D-erythritol 2,4-cyclodiphosphate synthase [Planctomycetota bacterium]|nr:2-C-methyl-D-erythritol 2,4-cyclodiphosphate synthase [Planctomycetota bacterium]